MFFTLTTLLSFLSLLLLAAATPLKRQSSQCDTGTLQCCKQVQPAGSDQHNTLQGMLGLTGSLANLPIGTTCSPINVGALGQGASCDAEPVCCEDSSSGGPLNLASAGCVPVTLSA
ncbi:fungal hydrophobin [Gloeophyllum trabeum ATCC 11539]|uniref:Hydrophobin n=1 Tax=Gloeophyllum trabeum (strain ATCC 11539 / FP-39264 / Madison 617) TaxID=670483 RepID=S7RI70_GLOTA|nr:fungal hydrophobin [Gloeophyllum trabeum ATCC 11539]EPQ52309.1 fungal hydrophobin [Gloeophyllum trabeum ATCC 11539]